MIKRPSPNFDERPEGVPIDILLLHYTGMASAEAALARLCDTVARVSAHYVIGEDGTLWRLVDERLRAWHAGTAYWRGARDVNARSIGIELVNPGHEFGFRPVPEVQIEALINLAKVLLTRHPIPPERVLGHSDVAPARKTDPGELFDWARLARAGIGLWPDDRRLRDRRLPDLAHLQRGLARFGYEVAESGEPDEATRLSVAAFQRHFRPACIDGRPDAETASRLEALLAHLPDA